VTAARVGGIVAAMRRALGMMIVVGGLACGRSPAGAPGAGSGAVPVAAPVPAAPASPVVVDAAPPSAACALVSLDELATALGQPFVEAARTADSCTRRLAHGDGELVIQRHEDPAMYAPSLYKPERIAVLAHVGDQAFATRTGDLLELRRGRNVATVTLGGAARGDPATAVARLTALGAVIAPRL
jgi:hypothetical protein